MESEKLFNLGVIGRPILQSLSPFIHKTALKQKGLRGSYIRLAAESVEEALTVGKELGLSGLNVTAPFKEKTLVEIKNFGREVSQVGAANTIHFAPTVSLYNTDLYGITHSLGLTGKRADGKTAIVIGAGGAAKAAAYALKQLGCRVLLCNRTFENADDAATLIGVKAVSFSDAEKFLKDCDYLINTVNSSEKLLDLSNLKARTLVLDAIYAKEIPFSASCKNNPNYIDGRTWLLNQGLRAFEIFTDSKITESESLAVKESLFSAVRSKSETISLIGMMGSGKSTVGSELSKLLKEDFVDLDVEVERKAGCSIAKLVTDQGEETFRRIESECLQNALELKPRVLSAGGGVIGTEKNREMLKNYSRPVWLWASKGELTSRLEGSSNRPLLFGKELSVRVGELLDSRFLDYADVSELVVPTAGKSASEIAKRIEFEFLNVG